MELLEFVNSMPSGTNDKIDFLKKLKDDVLVNKILEYTYDPSKTFGIKSSSVDYTVGTETLGDMTQFFDILDELSERRLSGNKARDYLSSYMSRFKEAELLAGILDKSLDLGINASTINKAIPGLISIFNVTLANKYKWNGKLPFSYTIASQKFDGVRCIAIKQAGEVKIYSRTGKEYTTLDNMKKEILRLPYDSIVLDGEIIRGDGTDTFQELMKEVRKKNYSMTDFTYMVFDIMSPQDFFGKTKNIYLDRMAWYPIEDGEYLRNVVQYELPTFDYLENLWSKALQSNWEGLMLRNAHSTYEAKRTNNLLKMKVMQDEEFEIVGYQEGEGRLKNTLGAIGVNVDGKTVWVGSGFTDSDRDEIWKTKPLGLATIQFFEKTNDGSLRFPVFKGFIDSL